METTLSKSIRTTDKKAEYDAVCKEILSEKIILAWILKDCVDEFRNIDVKEIAEYCIEGTPQVSEIPVNSDEEDAGKTRGRVNAMCNLSDGVFREGMERGAEIGAEKKQLENIGNLMDSMKLSVEQVMVALKIPEADWVKYKKLIK